MKTLRHPLLRRAAFLGGTALICLAAPPALAVDWDAVAGREIVFFYPGQASWEWVLTQADHSGGPKFREGKLCVACHEGEQADIGALIVSGEKVEPTPIAGKRGSFPVTVKTARDAERFYVRLEWAPQRLPDAPRMDPDYEIKVTMMIDDGAVVEATRAGCWGACHSDANGMAHASEDADITKYLARSRTRLTRRGGGLNLKPAEELAALAGQGMFLEYWQARLNAGAEPVAVGGHILEARTEHEDSAVAAVAEYGSDRQTVILSRPLTPGGAFEKALDPGKTYALGFAIHEAYAAHRFHHVSFGYSLRLDGGEADFIAAAK